MKEDIIRFQVTEEQEGERIDKCLTGLIDFVSRSGIQKRIKEQKLLGEFSLGVINEAVLPRS